MVSPAPVRPGTGVTLVVHSQLTAEDGPTELSTPVAVARLFAAGWALALAPTSGHRVLVLGIVAVGLIGSSDEPLRGALVLAGIALVAWRPSVPVPALAVPMLSSMAAASLWIYLTHWQVYPPLQPWGWVALLASLTFGLAAHRGELWLRRRVVQR